MDEIGRRSRASSNAPLMALNTNPYRALPGANEFRVGGPPQPPSPLALRAANSPSCNRRSNRFRKGPVDVQALEYVSTCDKNFVCLICHCPFLDPVHLECDHAFCHDCLDTAFEHQSGSNKCPTCRAEVDPARKPTPSPRAIISMLDELVVKCPNYKAGCEWQNKRVDVQDHVDLYCDFTIVECPESSCKEGILQKDFHQGGCLHKTVDCPDCTQSMQKKDLQHHLEKDCEKRMMTCPKCKDEVNRHKIDHHLKEYCPKATIPCIGEPFGCGFSCVRETMDQHAAKCPISAMAPYLATQKLKQEEQETAQILLQRRCELMEGSLNSIQSLLLSNPVPSPSSTEPPFLALPPNANSNAEAESSPPSTPAPTPANAPFDSTVHHLLSLYESLREEIGRVENALSELDARQSVSLLNENIRSREEMSHVNAAINSMRTQMHWLMSSHLQRSQNQGRSSTTAAVGSSNANPIASSSSSSNSMSGSGANRMLRPVRRLSDSTRQDTKL